LEYLVLDKIKRLNIKGLNGSINVEIPIVDNKIILVGVNGLGKSTTINVLYYMLSKQWQRLVELDFESIQIKTDKGGLTLNREEMREAITLREDLPLPASYIREYERLRDSGLLERFLAARPNDLRQFDLGMRIPPSASARLQSTLRSLIPALTVRTLEKAATFVDALIGENQILYLPTYRRIEKDLRTVIPDLEDYIRRFHDQTVRMAGRRTDAYIELVEFGMEDVQSKIGDTLKVLKESSRQLFNGLAGSYLKDVIRGEGQKYDQAEIMGLTDIDISAILNRVEENTLSDEDKVMLRSSIERLIAQEASNEDDTYVAHIFSKLVLTARALTEREKPVTRFAEVCNRYLEGKKFVYDEQKYELQILGTGNKSIELRDLSSGEKQIISLFSQLYLGGDRHYIIIIDEPELSLSVPWQQTLLPDVLSSGLCDFLAAVTHSPFIFENELDSYVQDMKDCVRIR
jgi:energy-coupling factor transporter ATP-binding protein EcfA2